MSGTIFKIALVTNFNIREKSAAAVRVVDYLLSYPCEIYIGDNTRDKEIIFASHCKSGKVKFVPLQVLFHETDLIIVLGGDGSILSSARNSVRSGIPLLGINLGRLGYMAEMEMDELPLLSRVFDGNYRIDERSMLDVTIFRKGQHLSNRATALNDAVVSNGSIARMIELELLAGGSIVTTYLSDGLIFSTPTGSTAYSMSAGGPVIDPNTKCICVTPICPHSLTAKPIVFSDEVELVAKNICDREKNLYLTLDGKVNYEIYRGDTVRVRKSTATTRLLRLKECAFYNTLYQKMKSN